jgi:mannose-6-phosphate isomerase-like protein (cupin superfamily)
MRVRQVVTGHDESGHAVVASDVEVAQVTLKLSPSTEYHLLWSSDNTETVPNEGVPPVRSTFFPAAGGYRFFLLTLLPNANYDFLAEADIEAGLREMDEKMPGLRDHSEPDNPGMHRTDTVDFEVVLSGEVTLELDDGVETVLGVGDTNVQNGTRHRWHNRGSEPATMACFIVGANAS